MNLSKVQYAVEADSFASMQLWIDNHESVKWECATSGIGVTVPGRVDSFVSLLIPRINGVDVLVWEATSELVDYKAIEAYILKECPLLTMYNMSDAMNFSNIINRIKESK